MSSSPHTQSRTDTDFDAAPDSDTADHTTPTSPPARAATDTPSRCVQAMFSPTQTDRIQSLIDEHNAALVSPGTRDD
ncbi:hypothetical protein [Natronolimnobius baerhuensis]|uniref:Uncharacterized protein n=1 Tax=Natronolimnobius baerhuensis TaxID=253108 RepID=A0A202EAY6_9EURY|nr:hypothetical protein [Natronolimnobius baerhuensis]OVE85402.1 hypothetical protein B2G88_00795 [Natronolimnobius baerhuensis]